MVAIMSVLLVLTLMTTISFNVAVISAFAEGEQPAQQEQAAQTAEGQAAPAEGDQAAQTAEGQAAEGDQAAQTAEGQAAEGGKSEGQIAIEEMLGEDLGDLDNDDDSGDPLDTGLRRKTEVPEITSTSAIVMSGSTSEVVYEKHSERKMSPGNIVMLMNAMVVIDNMYNDTELNNTVEITDKLTEYGDTFKAGETVSVGDLLQAMLIGGNGQAAEALATYSTSTRKAMELGLMDTQFSNPKGSYNAKTYSTAHDCAVIVQAAMRYQLIKDYLIKRNVTVVASSKDGDREITFKNTNPLLTGAKQSELYNLTKGGILGTVGDPVKGSQYAGAATVDDMQLIVILMDSKTSRVAYEAKALLEYGDTKVTRNTIVKAGKKVGTARVRYGNITHVKAYTETKGFAYVPPEGSTDLVQTQVVMFDNLQAPLKEGSKVGEFRIYVADELKGTVDLVTRTNITQGWWPSRYYIQLYNCYDRHCSPADPAYDPQNSLCEKAQRENARGKKRAQTA